MIINLIQWLLAIIAVEAVVEIIVDSELFLFWRVFLSKRRSVIGSYIAKLFTCGYCFSVWVAALVAWSLPGYIFNIIIADVILKTFVLHRLSNLMHELFHRWLNRHPFGLFVNLFTGKADNKNDVVIVDDVDPE
jgi:hypothetical protein